MELKPSSCGCGCSGGINLIFPCSGAADVGEVADHAARKLMRDGQGKMSCLAGIGGGVSGLVASAKAAEKLLVIDGCSLECAKKTMDQAGIGGYKYIQLAALGMAKGKTPVTDAAVAIVAEQGDKLLNACC
jgi:uncharacterized metal-binding protein